VVVLVVVELLVAVELVDLELEHPLVFPHKHIV
jgi:hypothetical protein